MPTTDVSAVPVLVLTAGAAVSATSRTLGAIIQAEGRQLAGMEAAQGDALLPALMEALHDPGIGCVLVVGGGSLAIAPTTRAALEALGGEPIDGYDALFRVLAFQEVGPAAMLAGVAARRVESTVFFALPEHADMALLAWRRLLEPNLSSLGAAITLAPPAPAPAAPSAAVEQAEVLEGGVHVEAIGGGQPPTDEDATAPSAAWKAGLEAMGGRLDLEAWAELPESFDRLAAARDVLNTAGERGVVTVPDGPRYLAFGFPDLRRNASKVLLVREALPVAEVVALHRHPRRVGVVAEEEWEGYLPRANWDPAPLAEKLTGRAPPTLGTLFAVDARTVYLLRERRVIAWDGRRETNEGTVSQALASLLLRWSSR